MTDKHLLQSTQSWTLSIPRVTENNGVSRVTCVIAGTPLWFESSTHTLRPSMEAFAGLMLVPALHGGITLDVEGPVGTTWLANIQHLLPVYHRWWGYAPRLPIQAATLPPSNRPRNASMSLCFSGGVDSFHSLLTHQARIKALVFAEGFDVPLHDTHRLAACRRSLMEVAAAFGKEPVLIRSNLREHPAFAHLDWLRTHGGAIAAVGHLLDDHFGTLMVSSSYNKAAKKPCGSHWETDAFHATETFALEHYGEDFKRITKLSEICHHPVAQKHLRVCWENRNENINCSICEKCVRTMIMLHNFGVLEHYPVFRTYRDLGEAVQGIPGGLSEGVLMIWRSLYDATRDEKLRAAIRKFAFRPSPEALRLPPWPTAPLAHLGSGYRALRRRRQFR